MIRSYSNHSQPSFCAYCLVTLDSYPYMHVLKKKEECLPDQLKFTSRQTAVHLKKKKHSKLCKRTMPHQVKGGNKPTRILLAKASTCVAEEEEIKYGGLLISINTSYQGLRAWFNFCWSQWRLRSGWISTDLKGARIKNLCCKHLHLQKVPGNHFMTSRNFHHFKERGPFHRGGILLFVVQRITAVTWAKVLWG